MLPIVLIVFTFFFSQIDQPGLGMPSRDYYFNDGNYKKVIFWSFFTHIFDWLIDLEQFQQQKQRDFREFGDQSDTE